MRIADAAGCPGQGVPGRRRDGRRAGAAAAERVQTTQDVGPDRPAAAGARDQRPVPGERNQTAALGGNILYLRSFRFMNLMKTDCPVGDKSQGCMDQSQSWYKVTFESYTCDAGALAELAEAPNPSNVAIFRWELKKKTPAPAPASEHAAAAQAPTAGRGSSRRRDRREGAVGVEVEDPRPAAGRRRNGRDRFLRPGESARNSAHGRRDHRLEEGRDPRRGHPRDVPELTGSPRTRVHAEFTEASSFVDGRPLQLTAQ